MELRAILVLLQHWLLLERPLLLFFFELEISDLIQILGLMNFLSLVTILLVLGFRLRDLPLLLFIIMCVWKGIFLF
jgi:hypothetical protein